MPRPLLLFLTLVALFNLSRVLREPWPDADRPMDFRTCYMGQAVLRQGQNPYQDGVLKAGWQRIVAQEQLTSRTQPGLPNLPFMYPPWAAALFGLSVGQLPYRWAWPLWYALAVAGLLAAARLWSLALRRKNDFTAVPWWQLLIAALALKGTVPALLTGQPTFLALTLGVGALVVGRVMGPLVIDSPTNVAGHESIIQPRTWGRPVLAGVLLGLAAFKVTLILPFALWFLYRQQWLTLAVATAVVVLLSVLALHWAHFPQELAPAYQQLIAQVRAQSFNPADPDYPLTQGMTLRLELGNVLEWLWPGSSPGHGLLHAGLWLAAGLRVRGLRKAGILLSDGQLFLVASTLTLLTTYHLYYDAVLLLPLLGHAMQLPRKHQLLLLLSLLPLLLPLNGVALALDNPRALHGLYFLPPIGLLGVLGVLLAKKNRLLPSPQPLRPSA